MKKYSRIIRKKREADMKVIRFKDSDDAVISSEEFINSFRVYVEDLALFKTANGRKFMRSTEYASIGIMDLNDVYQEAYLAFLEFYTKFKEHEANGNFDYEGNEKGAAAWAYLKKSTLFRLERQLRDKKDSVRIPERQMLQTRSVNTNMVTKLFSQLERIFTNNIEEVALTKWETDLIGAFLEVHMDDYLDLTRDGNRDFKKNEREIVKALFGIDRPRKTYKELSEYYGISQSTIRKVKERAIKRLQSEESKEKIANFLHEYRINTKADTEKYKK